MDGARLRTGAFEALLPDEIDLLCQHDNLRIVARHLRFGTHAKEAADPGLDRILDLAPDSNGHRLLSTAGLAGGHWLVQLRWTANARDYYYEQAVIAHR